MKQTLTLEEINNVSGSGIFYELGAFFAGVANAHDAIYAQYGNTARNNYW